MTESVQSDAEIIRRVLRGERELFRLLLSRYEGPIYRYALSKLGHVEDAEDVTQQVFLSAFKELRSFDTTRMFAPWLFRIASNAAASKRRIQRPAISFDADGASDILEIPAKADIAGEMDARLTLERIEREILQLPQESQTLFALRYREGKSIEEIAAWSGKKSGTIAVALHRLRERLQQVLHDQPKGRKVS